MRALLKSVAALAVATCSALSASAQAASGAGPYYATPSWDQTIPAATRFVVLTNMNSEAVLDRETGLVWEQSPSTTTQTWENARLDCKTRKTGSRMGWRLPSLHELASLTDTTQSSPSLPAGHPFSNVQSNFYWTATTSAVEVTRAWYVALSVSFPDTNPKSVSQYVWCVRGAGANTDTY